MTAGAPDVTEVESDRLNAFTTSAFVYSSARRSQWAAWTLSAAIFVVTAAASFGCALAAGNRRPVSVPVVRLQIATLPAPIVPSTPTPAPVTIEPRKTKPIDEVSAYDEIAHRRLRKLRSDESAAYDPHKRQSGQIKPEGTANKSARSDSSAGLGKNSTQHNPAKASPSTNW